MCWELGRNQGVGVEKRIGFCERLLPCIDIRWWFILLNYANDLQIPIYKTKDTSNTDLYSNISVDKFSQLDNYYSHTVSSVEAVFFWTNGLWEEKQILHLMGENLAESTDFDYSDDDDYDDDGDDN
ncbi:hypothetical protein Glove_71g141 [Diversispora epigaea]|uniref:Uncharacterized protein n=1 Tax=Diversispora epigaea TaxID=1348612 RepID=A0A397JIS7_9GLOM|nr:hypothetical protein Glove_71g141 [Diversispora epigaea]